MDTLFAVQILGVNEDGYASANETICYGRDLPWVQEGSDFSIWESWEVVYRDVIIVDSENGEVSRFNLTDRSLSEPENYEALRQLLLTTAGS